VRDRGEVALHEAVHACVAIALGRRVEWARIATHPVPGRKDLARYGGTLVDRGGELDRRDLCVFLAAGMHEGNGIAFDSGASDFGTWPPLWPVRDGEGDRGQVAKTIRLLGLTEPEYDDVVRETAELLDEPVMQNWIARTSLALERNGDLSGEEIEALRPSRTIGKKELCSI
jgi:hypothetical protein